MNYLVDTSVLVRALHTADSVSIVARQALLTISRRRDLNGMLPVAGSIALWHSSNAIAQWSHGMMAPAGSVGCAVERHTPFRHGSNANLHGANARRWYFFVDGLRGCGNEGAAFVEERGAVNPGAISKGATEG